MNSWLKSRIFQAWISYMVELSQYIILWESAASKMGFKGNLNFLQDVYILIKSSASYMI